MLCWSALPLPLPLLEPESVEVLTGWSEFEQELETELELGFELEAE